MRTDAANRKRAFESMDRSTEPAVKRQATADQESTAPDMLQATLHRLEARLEESEMLRKRDSQRFFSALEALQRDVLAIKESTSERNFQVSPPVPSTRVAKSERVQIGRRTTNFYDEDSLGQMLVSRKPTRLLGMSPRARNDDAAELDAALKRLGADDEYTKSLPEGRRTSTQVAHVIPSSIPPAENGNEQPSTTQCPDKIPSLSDGASRKTEEPVQMFPKSANTTLEVTRSTPSTSNMILRGTPDASNMIFRGTSSTSHMISGGTSYASNMIPGGPPDASNTISGGTSGTSKEATRKDTPSASNYISLDAQEYLKKAVVEDPDDMDYVPSNHSLSATASNRPADSSNEDTARNMIAPEHRTASTTDWHEAQLDGHEQTPLSNSMRSFGFTSQGSRKSNRGGKRPGAGRPRQRLAIGDGRLTPEWERDDWDPEAYSARIKDPLLKITKPSPREAAKRRGISKKSLLETSSRNSPTTATTSFEYQEQSKEGEAKVRVDSPSSFEKVRDAEGYILLPDGRRDGRSMRRKRPLEQHDANQSLRNDSPSIKYLPPNLQQRTSSDVGDTIELQGKQPAVENSGGIVQNTDRHASIMAKVFPKGFSMKVMPT